MRLPEKAENEARPIPLRSSGGSRYGRFRRIVYRGFIQSLMTGELKGRSNGARPRDQAMGKGE